MTALHTFLANKAADAGFWCPACRSRGLDADDMDLAGGWSHSDAMRALYGAACCKECTDDHVTTAEGDCLPRDRAFYSRVLDEWFSSDDARQESVAAAAFDAREWEADRAMYAEWV